MDVIGAQADDEEQDFIRRVCEQELLSSDNLLGLFAPLIKDICSSPLQYPDPQVIKYKDYVSLIIYINTTPRKNRNFYYYNKRRYVIFGLSFIL